MSKDEAQPRASVYIFMPFFSVEVISLPTPLSTTITQATQSKDPADSLLETASHKQHDVQIYRLRSFCDLPRIRSDWSRNSQMVQYVAHRCRRVAQLSRCQSSTVLTEPDKLEAHFHRDRLQHQHGVYHSCLRQQDYLHRPHPKDIKLRGTHELFEVIQLDSDW